MTNGTRRSQEIPVLRAQFEKNNKQKPQGQKQLYLYDKAVTDYGWWDKQKAHHNYMISVPKENASATWIEAIPFNRNDVINTGVEGYDQSETDGGIRFNRVTYRDPETRHCYQFITTLPASINPPLPSYTTNAGRLKRRSTTVKVTLKKPKPGLATNRHSIIKCVSLR